MPISPSPWSNLPSLGYIPHGHCFLWQTDLVYLHVLSDAGIALAYFSIPVILFYFIRKRPDLPFSWIFTLFGLFILSGGTTHLMAIWTLWHPDYWQSGGIKAVTAVVSLFTAMEMVPLVPQVLQFSSPEQLRAANDALQQINAALQAEIIDRQGKERLVNQIAETTPDLIYIYDVQEHLNRYSNSKLPELLGYSHTELQDMGSGFLFQLVHPDDREPLQQYFERLAGAGDGDLLEIEYRVRHCDGEYRWLYSRDKVFSRTKTGQVKEILGNAIDITSRRHYEEQLQRYERIVEATTNAIILLDDTYRYQIVNATYLRWHDRPRQDVIGQRLPQVMAEAQFESLLQPRLDRCMAGEMVQQKTWLTFAGIGQKFVNITYSPYREADGNVSGAVISLHDITALKQAEDALRREEARLQYLVSHSPVVIFSCKPYGDYGATFISENVEALLGWDAQAFLADSQFWVDHLHPDEAEQVLAGLANLFRDDFYFHEYRLRRDDGTYCWCLAQLRLIRDEAGNPMEMLGYLIDISNRKQTEEQLRQSEERFRVAFRDAAVGVATVSPDGKFLSINRSFCEVVGYSEDELCQLTFQEITHPDDLDADLAYVRQVLEGEIRSYQMEKRYFHKQGHVVWILLSVSLVRDVMDSPLYFIAQISDISDRKWAEAQLQASLQEKMVLLKEIHHRVKNNLQVISSLFRLQARSLNNPELRKHLGEGQNRLRAMALIHEKLYQSDNLSRIDLAGYIQDLTGYLFRSYTVNHQRVILRIEVDKTIFLDVDAAVPCGLIINEIVSNALKYAFDPGQTGTIWIQAKASEQGHLVLMIGDNGKGLPDGFDLKKTRSLGMNLIQDLTGQLRGTLAIDRSQGTQFTLTLRRIQVA
ncbi:multi-sensor signal transduction histidine kinase [Halomicronema hongdechloris C2206]|uniref:histidine kinase n=1 Tax=Halomicronema hongdechloris C2206 TaxID=1641165 RepID=A0A1Z3HIA9_9CYAN|nr:PAS domain S-box protein [Halomicronema hongdechloris]ASC70052.1 multi-sensor signal transduction histidine kinase [Halomicronema hongdechloris C2206]